MPELARPFKDQSGKVIGYFVWCEGCEELHPFRTAQSSTYDPQRHKPAPLWGFNGDTESPTFTPSLRLFAVPEDKTTPWEEWATRCHIIVTDGRIQFCGDCAHELKGTTRALVPPPAS